MMRQGLFRVACALLLASAALSAAAADFKLTTRTAKCIVWAITAADG